MFLQRTVACNMESENYLAQRLKNEHCYDGVETEPKESAELLHKLGLLYKEKSPNKICLLQSAALMTSAVARKPDNLKVIEKDLNDLCLHILTTAEASKPDTLLIDNAVRKAKQLIELLRETTNKKLKTLVPLADGLEEEKLKFLRKVRSNDIRKLQKYITDQYKDVMKIIASHVVKILGKPPCKFSVVGMGSLAREEVTPFSDFEHIIVLENEIQNVQNFENIVEYYRWFSTVLLLIIIRLGETILSCLGIPCLNHPLEKEKNWFYDKYTPCGIRPDGFAPHVSKNPLGRQTETPDKPWINELIKPVSEMVKYLDSEEDLKEGYHLADMLTKTCHIFGDVITFEQFQAHVRQRSNTPKIFGKTHVCQVSKDLAMCKMAGGSDHSKLDIKRFFYRSSSLFVHALGKLHSCDQSNGFELIDELLQRQIITDAEHVMLQFCLAVACETRLRTYCNAFSQQDVYYRSHGAESIGFPSCITNLTTYLGARALVDYLSISQSLQVYVETCFTSKTVPTHIDITECKYQISAAFSLGFFQLTDQHLREYNDLPNIKYSCQEVEFLCAKVSALSGCGKDKECWQQVKIYLRNFREWKMQQRERNETFLDQYMCHLCVVGAMSLLYTANYISALKYFRKANKIIHFSPYIAGEEYKAKLNARLGECFFLLGRTQKALRYIKTGNSPEDSVVRGWGLLVLSKFDEAKLLAEELINQRKSLHVDEDHDIFISMACHILSVCYQKLGKFKESLHFHDNVWKPLKVTNLLSSPHLKSGEVFAVYLKLMDCIKLAQKAGEEKDWDLFVYHSQQAEKLLSENDSFLKQTRMIGIPSFGEHPRVLLCNDIATRLLSLKKYNEALIYAKKGLSCSLKYDWPLGFHESTTAAILLVKILFLCSKYNDCLCAAKHVVKMYLFTALDNFNTDCKFRAAVKYSQCCEKILGISSTLPYDCSPSVFFSPITKNQKQLVVIRKLLYLLSTNEPICFGRNDLFD